MAKGAQHQVMNPRHHAFLVSLAIVSTMAVVGVAGMWIWSRFPLSGDTGYNDNLVSFVYDRTTTTTVKKTVRPLTDVLKPDELAATSSVCPIPHNEAYYQQLLARFPSGAMAATYTYVSRTGVGQWTMTIIPNSPKYSDWPEFSYDFNSCGGGGVGQPYNVSHASLLFGFDCSIISAQMSAEGCLATSRKVSSDLKLR